ncbi:MAG: hypothetical protein M1834_003404 [Cirrosporium novae-zelandiae]|nr:MAG: hypothetical protein M1834_003404 [Cirrosporium novae-zelandiae]
MSNPQPPSRHQTQTEVDQFQRFQHYLAYGFIVVSPLIVLTPPRKLNLYTFSLGAAFVASLNHIIYEKSGRSIMQRLSGLAPESLPSDRARLVHERLRREKELRGQVEDKSLLEKVWLGEEKEGWRERRLQEEKEALEQGKGYSGLIMDHIREAWNWGQKKEESRGARNEQYEPRGNDEGH